MILIKGFAIALQLTDGRWIEPPKSHGFMHDTTGELLDRCYVYIGPYKRTRTPADLSGAASWYFGFRSKGVEAQIDVPKSAWNPLGTVKEILYSRIGSHSGDFHHAFAKKALPKLSRSGRWMRLSLPTNCVLDWRGFVYP